MIDGINMVDWLMDTGKTVSQWISQLQDLFEIFENLACSMKL